MRQEIATDAGWEAPVRLPAGMSERQWATCFSPRVQELIILPTEKCNFRCTYCYEDFKVGRMPERVRRGVERFISRRAPELDVLQLSWFGGEPLLAKDVVLRIARHAFALSREHGFALMGGFTTNGYLLAPELAADLIALKQDRFQITLDGWEEGHDETRRKANGAGTFDVIWSNLVALRRLGEPFEVTLRVHLSPANARSAERLCAEIAREFGDDGRFHVNFQDIRDLGGAGGERVAPLTSERLRARVERLTDLIVSRSPRARGRITNNLDTEGESAGARSAEQIAAGGPYVCYASKPNSLLIRADGRLGKCTVMLDGADNHVGELAEDGTVSIDPRRLQRWFHGLGSLDLNALACPAKSLPEPLAGDGSARAKPFPVPVRAVQ